MIGASIAAPINFLVWAFSPSSTRDRSIRLSILILLILALAFAALAFKTINIDIPGIKLKREATGPLGLKLGLDLRGGGHLIYQADTGTRFDVTFLDPITSQEVAEALAELCGSVRRS